MSGFHQILAESRRIARENPGHVFIGGVAVYLHATSSAREGALPEMSHDVDLMISLADFGALRDSDEVTVNRRLAKHQLIRAGIDFDIYVERQNNLAIPYDDAFASATIIKGMRVACLEHLLILKLNAHGDRAASAKGDKDRRDIVNIVLAMGGKFRQSRLVPYLREKHMQTLLKIEESPVFLELTAGNAHQAKKLRTTYEKFVRTLEKRKL